jgi:hypothetical protein
VITEKLKIINNTDASQKVLVYPVDATVTNTGMLTCEQRAERRDGPGAWIKFDGNEVTVAPGANALADFTIRVPDDADVGEHNACVALEMADAEADQTGNLRVRTRSAIRVAITVPGDLHRSVSITSFDVSQQGMSQSYTLKAKNEGNVSADVRVNVALENLFGQRIYTNGGEYPVLADKELELTYKNDDLPAWGGWYYVEGLVSYDKRAGKYGTADKAQLVDVYAPRKLVFIAPKTGVLMVGIIVLIIMGVGGYLLWRRRQALKQARKGWREYVVRHGDTILTLADARKTHWKQIAKVNHLHPPYNLAEGERLLLPKKPKKMDSNT